jgi:hypothetical protein
VFKKQFAETSEPRRSSLKLSVPCIHEVAQRQ